MGLKRYFDGTPCKKGHVADRLVSGRGRCAVCEDEYQREWRAKNRDKWNAYALAGYHRNPGKQKARQQRNRDKIREQVRANRRADPEKFKEAGRQWRAKNKEKWAAYWKAWATANPDKVVALAHKKRARKRAAEGTHSANDVADIFKAQRGRCAYCRNKLKNREWHVDHKTALSKGGTNDRTNLQICCPSCNTKKHAKDPVDFAREMGLLI